LAAYFFWLLFSWRGRIGRGVYALSWLSLVVINVLLSRFMHVATAQFVSATPEQRLSLAGGMVGGLAFYSVAALILCWVHFAVSAKRLHDFGWSGLWIFAPAAVLILGAPYEAISELARAAAAHFLAGAALSAATKLHIFAWAIGWIFGSLALWAMMLFRGGDDGVNGFEGDPTFGASGGGGAMSSARARISATAINGSTPRTAAATNWPASPADTTGKPPTFGRRGARV
jgi:uncharacterized membrane protein YhaH (DUF805 family)